jgi:hypothetical protein
VEERAPFTLRDETRLDFFRTIRRREPEVLKSLCRDVLPAYQAATQPTRYYPVIWGHLWMPERDKAYQDAIRDAGLAILSWATRWRLAWIRYNVRVGDMVLKSSLANGFCLDQTIETLNAWCWFGVPSELDWAYTLRHKEYQSFSAQYIVQPRAFEFEYLSWLVHADTWKSYEKKLDEAYRAAKKSYRQERLEYAAISSDILPAAVEKRNPAHLDWLVDYLIKNMTFAAIAREYGGHQGLNERSVANGIYGLVDLLGLTLPYRRIGRPRKNPPDAAQIL